jgi:hypothetical protein
MSIRNVCFCACCGIERENNAQNIALLTPWCSRCLSVLLRYLAPIPFFITFRYCSRCRHPYEDLDSIRHDCGRLSQQDKTSELAAAKALLRIAGAKPANRGPAHTAQLAAGVQGLTIRKRTRRSTAPHAHEDHPYIAKDPRRYWAFNWAAGVHFFVPDDLYTVRNGHRYLPASTYSGELQWVDESATIANQVAPGDEPAGVRVQVRGVQD